MVANIDPEIILTKPNQKLWQWITNSHTHMQAHYKTTKLRAQLCTHHIHNYLKENVKSPIQTTTANNLLRPPLNYCLVGLSLQVLVMGLVIKLYLCIYCITTAASMSQQSKDNSKAFGNVPAFLYCL